MTAEEHLDPQRLARVLGPAGPELTCDECFEQLDRYVEVELVSGQAHADREVPWLAAHLQGCPACREDHDSLLAYLQDPQST